MLWAAKFIFHGRLIVSLALSFVSRHRLKRNALAPATDTELFASFFYSFFLLLVDPPVVLDALGVVRDMPGKRICESHLECVEGIVYNLIDIGIFEEMLADRLLCLCRVMRQCLLGIGK